MPSVVADLAATTTASLVRRRIDLPRAEGSASFRQQFQELAGTKSPAVEPKRREEPAATDRAGGSRNARRPEKAHPKSEKAGETDGEDEDVKETRRSGRKAEAGDDATIDAVLADDGMPADSGDAADAETSDDAPSERPTLADIDPSLLTPTAATPPVDPAATGTPDAATAEEIGPAVADATSDSISSKAVELPAAGGPDAAATDAGEVDTELAAGTELPSAKPAAGRPSTGVSALGESPAPATESADDFQDAPADAEGAPSNQTLTSGFEMMAEFAEVTLPTSPLKPDAPTAEKPADAALNANPAVNGVTGGAPAKATGQANAASPAEPTTEARFAADNHPKIASEVRGVLLRNGGRMELKLDPPELGSLQVSLHIRDGVVTASFQTQNPDAARLLSHTLSDLRQSLEAQGVVVDKLHVQQAPRNDNAGNDARNGDGRPSLSQEQQQENRREQQRKDMVQRLWDRLSGNAPIDVRA